jgi:TonB-linked SusC/RagA family outer membrane protein
MNTSFDCDLRSLAIAVLFLSFFFIPSGTFAQQSLDTRVSLSVRNMKLDSTLRDLERQTSCHFMVNADLIAHMHVTIRKKDIPLKDMLNEILPAHGLGYELSGNYILIKKNRPVRHVETPAIHSTGTGARVHVTGTVTDVSGSSLQGASINIRNSSRGTLTDKDGRFSMEVSDTDVLVITYTGYVPEEVTVESGNALNIRLSPGSGALNDVVVIGYGTQKKRDVTGAISSVKPEQLDKATAPTVTQMLQGQAAGLTVFNTSQPGGSSALYIRGATSTGAGNDPLIVIDGFPIVNDAVEPGSGNKYYMGSRSFLNDINPNDIASIEVLKDASATAIYGARGSNGVILITTRRGKTGTDISYDFNTTVQTMAKRPELLDGKNFMIQQNEYLRTYYLQQYKLAPYGTTDPNTVPAFVPRHSDADIAAAGAGTDWYDLVTRKGIVNQHDLTISQGNSNVKALISLNYFNQQGVVKGSGLDRYSIRINLDQNITKWWDYGISLTGAVTNEKNSTLGDGRDDAAGILESAMDYSPLIKPVKDPQTGKWLEDPAQSLLPNPLSFLDIRDNTRTQRVLSNLYTNIYITRDIWFRLNFGEDIRSGLRQSYYPRTTKYGAQVNGEADINNSARQDYLTEWTFNIKKSFNGGHRIQGLLGYSYQNMNGNGAYERAQNFSTDALLYDALQAGTQIPIVSSYRSKHILVSYFTRWQYSYDDKYLLSLSARIDGSDRFGANNRYAFFPSASFAWRMNQENFLKTAGWISDLKLRAGIGQVGNENIANDAASEYYAYNGANYYYDGSLSTGVSLAKYANPNLKWESTTEYDLGLDFGVFNNRLYGSADVYYKTVSDLLTYRKLPSSSVVGNIPWNAGTTQGKGLELTLNSINIVKPFRWTTLLTYTAYRDSWKHRDPLVILQPYQGPHDQLSSVFALRPDGIKQADENTPSQPSLLPGQQKYKDLNSLDANGRLTGKTDNKINQADAALIGTTAPKFSIGLNNTFEYKGFDLNCFFYASCGALKWSYTRMEHSVYGSYGTQRFKDNYNFLAEVANRWTPSHTNTSMPSGDVNSYDAYGSPYWQKATYLRLKTLSIGYNLSSSLIRSKWVKTSRIYFSVQNAFTLTGYDGLDPEVENDRASYPQQRSFSIGADLKF